MSSALPPPWPELGQAPHAHLGAGDECRLWPDHSQIMGCLKSRFMDSSLMAYSRWKKEISVLQSKPYRCFSGNSNSKLFGKTEAETWDDSSHTLWGTRKKQESGVVQAGKHNYICPGINLINLSTSKHKCTVLLLDSSWLEQSHPENLFPTLLSRTGWCWCSCASRDVPTSHICSLPLTGITCSPDTCGAAVMLGILGTSGGIWDWVNLIILLLIGFKIHLEIGRRCLVPVTTDGSRPAEVCLAGVGMKSWARADLASRH